jgi:flagellin
LTNLNEASEWAQTVNGSGNTTWAAADILTQSAAQVALSGLDQAINEKDTARASLGATQNRLENTITNLQIQAENLQAAESRISDVDVATEMTTFTSNNILAQSAVAMLAQANSLPSLALSLLGGA